MANQSAPLEESPTVIIVLLNIVVYIYTSIIGRNFITTDYRVLVQLGQFNYFVIYRGAYWQLFTAMFVHVNIVHLASNMLFLLIFGLRAESIFTKTQYLTIYFASGLFGNLLSLLLPLETVSAGASGAIFGVFGACVVFMFQSIIAVVFYSFFLLMMNTAPNVNLFAHFGGLVIGLMLGYLFAEMRRMKVYRRRHYHV